ncbi:bud neck involved protein [Haplosporangium gracile]|nr:bud neck involved protein [Haplosporangium gracile]
MEKPFPPAVSISYVVGGSIGGGRRASGGGPGSVTTPSSAMGSPSDLYPLVGRDVLVSYGSLSAAALTTASTMGGETAVADVIASVGFEAPKLRPMSSMENVEFAWSPTTTTTPVSPTTTTTSTTTSTSTTEADGRAIASSRSRYDASPSNTTAAAVVMSLDRHNNSSSCPAAGTGSYPDSLAKVSGTSNRNRQNSDQGTVGTMGRVSLDQQSIHPLQLDPDLPTTTEEDEEQDGEMEEGKAETVTMLTKGDDRQQGTTNTSTTAPTTALLLTTITPVTMAMATASPSLDSAAGEAGTSPSGGDHDPFPSPSAPQPQQQQQQQVVRKKTSFAAKLRKVFNNSKALPPTPQDASTPTANSTVSQYQQEQQMQTQEDIIFLAAGDDLVGNRATSAGGVTTRAEMVALMDQQQQHRGSVSSASSIDTTVDVHQRHGNSVFLRRGSHQTETPSTSPEASPCGSPTGMSSLNAIMSTTTDTTANQQPGGSGVVIVVGPIPSRDIDPDNTQHRHPLSGSEFSASSSSLPTMDDVESNVSTLAVGMPRVVVPLPTNQTAADIASALQPPPLPATPGNPTRTVKKRLSFASISSFFSPRNGGSVNNSSTTAQQEARAKQQRASSVPHVESPLVTVGRQIAGFQRRHSLNDLHDNKGAGVSKISRVGVNPWEKDPNAPLPAAADAGQGSGGPTAAAGVSTANNHVSQQQQGVPKPVKKLSLNNVFNKGLRKKKKNAAANAAKPESPLPAKPLRSALANRSKITQLGSEAAAHQQQQPKVHLVHRSSVVVAGRRRSASIRSQSSSHRRHHRLSQHQHQHHHGHHQHHGHNNHQHTDPFARLAEANHALATLSRRGSDDQTAAAALRLQQQQQYQTEEFSSLQEELDFCASPLSYDSTSGGLSPSLDTYGLHYHHNNQSQEGLSVSPMRPSTGVDGTTMDSSAFSTPSTPRVLPVVTKTGTNPSASQQQNPLSTLSPSSSCCSHLSSSSSSDDVESCSSSSCSSRQEPVAPESTAILFAIAAEVSGTEPESVAGSSSSCRNSAERGAVFNPLLPASAARVSVNRIAMEPQQKAGNNNTSTDANSDRNSNDAAGKSSDNNETPNNNLAGAESASTMSSSSTEVSSTTSSSASSSTINNSTSPAKKSSVTIMNTVAEDASEEEAMMHAQLAYIQQQQQHYLVQQQPYQHQLYQQQMQQQQEQHYHHYHVHYRPQDYHHHPHPHHHHYHHSHQHQHQQAGYAPIPSEPHHHQPYYYPHPSLFPPRPPRQLQFSTEEPLVYPTWTPEQYDRTSDAYITASRLTPAIANKIKLELNQFKSQEMLVHEESRVYTHFFI